MSKTNQYSTMDDFVLRYAPLGDTECLSYYVRVEEHPDCIEVFFRDDPAGPMRGVLTSHFEYIASNFKLELFLRGLLPDTRNLRFFQDKPAWTNGFMVIPAQRYEVTMNEVEGRYRYARFSPVPAERRFPAR